MLRAWEEKGGIGVYTQNITKELLDLDRDNQYILFYRNPAYIGTFSHYENVVERCISAYNKAAWDQISIPIACKQEKVDVLFHPKFTVPLIPPCKTVMVLHGAGWFMPEFEKFWSRADLRYVRVSMPLYCRRASAVISVSQLTTEIFNREFKLPAGKIKTVYFAPARNFSRVTDRRYLEQVRAKYNLPDCFIFTLSGYDRGDRKNIAGILQAYRMHHGRTPHKLVIAGKDCIKFKADYAIPDEGYGRDIIFTGWIDQVDLPAIYSLADVFLYPSNVEAFPIPITEALACGTPIITSNSTGLQELVGEAGLKVDPRNYAEIAEAVAMILEDQGLRARLSAKGIERSQTFSWDKCARQTLSILSGTLTYT
jgi:glycosyltransferase involved in cell wall biosynthesis